MAILLSTYRDRVKLHENGYLYVFDKMSSNGEKKFWRCERKSECNARVHTDAVTNQVVKRSSVHNHPSNPYIVQRCGVLAVSNKRSRDSGSGSETSKSYGELSSLSGEQLQHSLQDQHSVSHISGPLSSSEMIDSILQQTQKGLTDENEEFAASGEVTTTSSRKRRRDSRKSSVVKDLDKTQSIYKDQNNIACTSRIDELIKKETSESHNNFNNLHTASSVFEVPEQITISTTAAATNMRSLSPPNKRNSKVFRAVMNCNSIDRLLNRSFIKWSPKIAEIIKLGETLVNMVLQNNKSQCTSLLITGAVNCGKTYLAAKIAKLSEIPILKVCLPDDFVGCSEATKVSTLCKVFEDVYKSSVGIIVLDSIDRLIDYCAVGNRFSNMVLQTLYILLKKIPPPGHRLLIIGTSEENCTKLFQLKKQFTFSIDVPTLTTVDDLMTVIESSDILDETQLIELRQVIADDFPKFSCGVKRILDVLDLCKQRDSAERVAFIHQLLRDHALL